MIKVLLEEGNADPLFKDNYKETVLFYLAREGKVKCIDYLSKKGLDLNEPDVNG